MILMPLIASRPPPAVAKYRRQAADAQRRERLFSDYARAYIDADDVALNTRFHDVADALARWRTAAAAMILRPPASMR